MKKPREVLLQQRESAAPKLDAIRASVVADLRGRTRTEAVTFWEFVRSVRWHLAAMGAAWALAAVLDASGSADSSYETAKMKRPTEQQIALAMQEMRRLALELGDPPATATAAQPLGRRSAIEQQQEEA